MMCAVSYLINSPKEIILSGNTEGKNLKELINVIFETYIPNKIMVHSSDEMKIISDYLTKIVQESIKDEVYVCENYKCNLPVDNPEKLKEILR